MRARKATSRITCLVLLALSVGCSRTRASTVDCDGPLLEVTSTFAVAALHDAAGTKYDRLDRTAAPLDAERIEEIVRRVNATRVAGTDEAQYRVEQRDRRLHIDCVGCGGALNEGRADAEVQAHRTMSCFLRAAVAANVLPAHFADARVRLSPRSNMSISGDGTVTHLPPSGFSVDAVATHRGIPLAGTFARAFISAAGAFVSFDLPLEGSTFISTDPSVERVRTSEDVAERFAEDVAQTVGPGEPKDKLNWLVYRETGDGTYVPMQERTFFMVSKIGVAQRGGQKLIYRIDSSEPPSLRR